MRLVCSMVLLALAITVTDQAAQAQVIPGPTPLYPTDPSKPLYYKDGNGPGMSYFQRWLPSDNGCSQLTKQDDLVSQYTNGIKCIPLSPTGDSYLTLNGTERLRSETYEHSGLHAAAGFEGGHLIANGDNESERWLTHTEAGADLHLTDNFRAYLQLDNATQSGRQIQNPGPVAANRNDLSAMAAFAEGRVNINNTLLATPALDNTILGLRVGRENTGFGSDSYWSTVNGGTNLAGSSLDGIHAYADQGFRRLDIFGYRFVNEVDTNGNLDTDFPLQDRENAHQLYWGAYFSNDLPQYKMLGLPTKTGIDAFYYGYSNASAQYTNTAFLKTPGSTTIIPGGSSFITAADYRNEVGLRYYGDIGALNIDWSGVLQGGSFDGYNVDAWAFHTSTGFKIPSAWKWWAGVWFDGASGGVSRTDHTISTFQPIRQNPYAISTTGVPQALSNVIDFSPRISFNPDFFLGNYHVHDIYVTLWDSFYFRQNQNDAVYGGTYFGNQLAAPYVNPYQTSALFRGSFIGQQPDLRLSWVFAPHFSYGIDAAYEFVGGALKNIGAQNTLIVRNQLVFDF